MGSITYLPHTADAAVEVEAASREELFELGARALYFLVLDADAVEAREERVVTLMGSDLGALFHAWLAELLYLLDAGGWVARRFAFTFDGDGAVTAVMSGEALAPARHDVHGEVKNVTYCDYEVEATPDGGYRARVIFDL